MQVKYYLLPACSYLWMGDEQQVQYQEQLGAAGVLRCRGVQLHGAAVLRTLASLRPAHPRQLRAGDHHHNTPIELWLLLLPLLLARGTVPFCRTLSTPGLWTLALSCY